MFINNEPLMDFPKPTTHRTVDIGGIVVSNGFSPLNKTWSEIMNLRPKTILLSFGTYVKGSLMPEDYKTSIREAITSFPDVTFVWKYEKPEHNISRGVSNIVESTWVPQQDMLHDARLTAFITHCGQGSMMESAMSGVPLIAIPVIADQLRNGQLVKRHGLGVVLEKTDLADSNPLEDVIRAILNDARYLKNAKRLAKMLQNKPFEAKDIFLKNVEFLAEFGPLRQLNHYGMKLNFFQYFLIDVFAFLAASVVISLSIVVFAIWYVFRQVAASSKAKSE